MILTEVFGGSTNGYRLTVVTTNTRPRTVFPLCLNLSFCGRQSNVSLVCSRALTEKVPSSLNEGCFQKQILKPADPLIIRYVTE